jgi:hypothetical protein
MQIQFGSDKDNLGKISNPLCLQHISSLFESPQLYCRSHFEDIHILAVRKSNLFINALLTALIYAAINDGNMYCL